MMNFLYKRSPAPTPIQIPGVLKIFSSATFFLQKEAPPINPTNENENVFTYLTTSDISGSIFDPLIDLVQNDEVQGRLFEASRQFFTSSNITVTKKKF